MYDSREDENFRNLIEHGEYLSRIEDKVRESEEAKEKVVELDDKINDLEKQLADLRIERSNLQSKIIDSVEELQGKITEDTEKIFNNLRDKHKRTDEYTCIKSDQYSLDISTIDVDINGIPWTIK